MKKILIETSARHVHVDEETFKILFGENEKLNIKKELSQPGQFASDKRVTIKGPKGELVCTILGPFRKANQIELSYTDARIVGIEGVLRESGDIVNTPGCTIKGPCGEVEIKDGVIIAKRHIHMTENDAKELNVKNGDIVSVEVIKNGLNRGLTFHDVVIRVSNSFSLAMHIDTDESNAGALSGLNYGVIVK